MLEATGHVHAVFSIQCVLLSNVYCCSALLLTCTSRACCGTNLPSLIGPIDSRPPGHSASLQWKGGVG